MSSGVLVSRVGATGSSAARDDLRSRIAGVASFSWESRKVLMSPISLLLAGLYLPSWLIICRAQIRQGTVILACRRKRQSSNPPSQGLDPIPSLAGRAVSAINLQPVDGVVMFQIHLWPEAMHR